MDTDNLTPMAYETLNLAYSAIDVLRSEIGVSAMQYETEEEFLKGSIEYIEDILSEPKEYLDSWNYLDEVNIKGFIEKVKKVRDLDFSFYVMHRKRLPMHLKTKR
ncbi:MAG: hypothetical protein ACE5KZ_03010 [Candidatus Scalinduaceae bacterium]